MRIPSWAVLLIVIALVSILIVSMSYITRSPEDAAIAQCYSEMKQSVEGAAVRVDYGALQEQCNQMCAKGQLEGC